MSGTDFYRSAIISIHALLAESDTIFAVRPYDAPIFLSTLSLRRATRAEQLGNKVDHNFYPRSPCGERLVSCNYFPFDIAISIHALLAESDVKNRRLFAKRSEFLSTLSLRRATHTGVSTTFPA